MHEFALADAVVAAALDEARRNGLSTIDRIVVTVGELQEIEQELFEFSLTQVIPLQEPLLEGTEFVVEGEAASFACRACSREFSAADVEASEDEREAAHFIPELSHAFVRCPDCGSPDFEIVAGRGVTLRRIEGHAAGGNGS